MEVSISRSSIITSGLAIFAMLFGAGNIVFALAVGQFAQDKAFFGTLGLIASGVAVPLLGLIAMTLFDGNYKIFFERIGRYPGMIITLLMLGLLGPFGVIPRCIALSYSTLKVYLPNVPLSAFSLGCCLFIFLFTVKRTKILDLLGYVLTPLKLTSLLFLIVWGFLYAPSSPEATHNVMSVFSKGFIDGYQTMDLLGAFFICSVVLDGLRKKIASSDAGYQSLVKGTVKASCIGAFLLALIYVGFSYVAAFHSDGLQGSKPEELVSKVATMVLGTYGGIFVCFTVTIACMTTAIALTSVFAEFVYKEVSKEKVSYSAALAGTLVVAFIISTLNFTGIIKMLAPILYLCYPALIVLCLVNILYKLRGFQPVKIPVMIAFVLSIVGYFI